MAIAICLGAKHHNAVVMRSIGDVRRPQVKVAFFGALPCATTQLFCEAENGSERPKQRGTLEGVFLCVA